MLDIDRERLLDRLERARARRVGALVGRPGAPLGQVPGQPDADRRAADGGDETLDGYLRELGYA